MTTALSIGIVLTSITTACAPPIVGQSAGLRSFSRSSNPESMAVSLLFDTLRTSVVLIVRSGMRTVVATRETAGVDAARPSAVVALDATVVAMTLVVSRVAGAAGVAGVTARRFTGEVITSFGSVFRNPTLF